MKYDRELSGGLEEMAAANAILHVPFFANTFPLGYHYLEHLGEERARLLLSEHRWQEGSPVKEAERRPHVYYAAATTVEADKERFGDQVKEIFITQYNPRLFFLRYSVGLRHMVGRECPPEGDDWVLTEGFVRWIGREYDWVEIFTDIPEQASLVGAELERMGLRIPVRPTGSWFEAFAYREISLRRLEGFFYGAPLSAALRRKPLFAIPFRISVAEAQRRLFRTYVCVLSTDERMREEIGAVLDTYHRRLMSLAAARPSPSALRDVWWVYNRYATIWQHNSEFPSPEAFGDCLLEHHEYAR